MPSEAQLLKAIKMADDDGNEEASAELRAMLKQAAAATYVDAAGPSPYDQVAGGAMSLQQGAMFNFGDELMGGINAVRSRIGGDPRPLSETYGEGRDAARGLDDEFRENNPKTALGLNVAGGVLGPGKFIAGGRTYGEIAKRGALAGATAGFGAGEGEPGSQAVSTAVGGVLGLTLAPAAAWGTRQAANAGNYLGDQFRRAGVTLSGQVAPEVTSTVSTQAGPTLIGQTAQGYAAGTSDDVADALGERGRLAVRARELGMPLTYGDRTGDATARRVEAGLKSNPLTSMPFDRMRDTRIDAVTGRVARGLGLGDEVTEIPSARLGQAADEIGDRFNQVASDIGGMQLPETVTTRIQNIKRTEPFLELVAEMGDDITSPALLNGRDVMSIRSSLGKASAQAWRAGDQLKGQYIDDTIDAIDSAIEGRIPEASRANWSTARRQWRLLLATQRGQSLNEVTGKVNPGSFRNSLRKVYPNEYLRGGATDPDQVDLFDSVRVANLANDIVGDSGTATRLGFMGLIRNPIETSLTLAARPVVNAYASNGGPVLASAMAAPGQAGAVGARASGGVLAPSTRSKRRRGR